MERKSIQVLAAIALAALCGSASAQMVVHAMSGMVKAINANSKTMDVAVDNGTTSEFKLPNDAKVSLDFDNALRSDSVDASKFEHIGDFVVVYYYGYDNDLTAVAVKDLGAGPFEKIEGTVTKYDKHDRTVTIQDDGGKSETFTLDEHMVVDSGMGVDSGRSYGPHKGDHISVTYRKNGDTNTTVFIRAAVA
jgi:hypothetical protein